MDRLIELTQYPYLLNIQDLIRSCPDTCNSLANESIGNGNPDLSGIGVSCVTVVTRGSLHIYMYLNGYELTSPLLSF